MFCWPRAGRAATPHGQDAHATSSGANRCRGKSDAPHPTEQQDRTPPATAHQHGDGSASGQGDSGVSHPPDFSLFLGRLHPLAVHLPIGLLVLLGFLELLARWPRCKQAAASAGFILALAVPAALFSALCGWLLSLGGGYDDHLLRWHKWLGLTTAGLCLAAALLYGFGWKRVYRWVLAGSIGVLVVASHFGGSLTHGRDYLTQYAPAPLRRLLRGSGAHPAPPAPPADPAQVEAFAGVVGPILEQNCVACHGPDKSKGKLRLDTYAAVLEGGGSGPAIVPGKARESSLLKRVQLPEGDEDHMPPEGRTPLAPEDVALLQWWVDSGAPEKKKIGELNPPANLLRILEGRLRRGKPSAQAEAPPALAPLASAAQQGVSAKPLGQAHPLEWVETTRVLPWQHVLVFRKRTPSR